MEKEAMKKKAKSYFSVLLCIGILISAIHPFRALADEVNPKTIKVGFFAFDGYHEIDQNGVRSGYGYDFLSLLRRYTNFNYEYVGYDKSWNDMQQMLLDGEIDMVTSAHRTREREELFEYSLPIGINTLKINVRMDDNRFTAGDYATYDGMILGLIKGSSLNSKVHRFAVENHFSYTAKYYADVNELEEALQQKKIDAIAASSLRRSSQEKTIAEFNMESFYAIVKKGNTELMDEINNGIDQMNVSESDWMNALFYKNYDLYNYCSLNFSPEERAYIEAHSNGKDPVRIAFNTNWAPFSLKNEKTYKGILSDYWKHIAEVTGLDYEICGYSSWSDAEQDLLQGRADLFIGYRSEPSASEEKGLVESSSFLTVGACMIARKDHTDSVRIGISRVNSNLNELLPTKKQQEVYEYKNAREAIKALERGNVDQVFLYAYEGEYIINKDTSGMLYYQIVPDISISLCAAVGETREHALIGIVSKCVNAMTFTEANTIIARNLTVRAGGLTAADYCKMHPGLVMLSALGLSVLLMSIVLVVHKNRIEKEHSIALEEKVNEITELNTQLVEKQARLEKISSEQEAQLEANEILNRELQSTLKFAEVASKAKTDFLFSMSHDIRTPMNAIIGFANLMKTNGDDPEKCRDYLDKIISSSEILLNIINNVLEMARIENGKLTLSESTCSVQALFQSMSVIFEQEMEKKNIRYISRVNVLHDCLYCDGVKIQELFGNILSNAVKYTPAGGQICTEVKELISDKEGYALIQTTVRDTGNGMSEDFLPRIFEEFAREKTVTENQIPGTGLGMAIVKKLVDLMGGSITVESEIGKGTTFSVTLCHRISNAEKMEKMDELSGFHTDFEGKRVLLAEDNELNAEISVSILENLGIIAERAADGIECVDMIKTHVPGYYEMVLMDIQMPNLDGFEATRRIRALDNDKKADIPIVAMTANAFEEDRKNAWLAGMNGHLSKPIDMKMLIEILERFMQKGD